MSGNPDEFLEGVHAFSQPLVVKNAPDPVVVSTPMHFAISCG